MKDLFWILASFSIVLFFYARFTRRPAGKPDGGVPAEAPAPISSSCEGMIAATSTNNSYSPMGNVLASLDLPQVQEILGEELHPNMEDYM